MTEKSRMIKFYFVKYFCLTLLIFFGLFSPNHLSATVKLPAIFSDGMILQRDQTITIWGFGDVGEQITVRIAGQTKTTVTDSNGDWVLKIEPLRIGSPLQLIVVGKNNTIELNNVLVGDVFLLSGQSNMAMSLDACKRFGAQGIQEDANITTLAEVRIFQTPNATFAPKPAKDVAGEWQSLKPERNLGYSAIAFYFAKALHEHLKIPIGIIRASHAGGPIEAKMPLEALVSVPCGKAYNDDNVKKSSPEMLEKLNSEIMARWEKEVKDVIAVGQIPPPKPEIRKPLHGAYPAADWNGVIAPVIKYTKKAIFWYQGEHNTGRAFNYRELFPAMIHSWREASENENLPFLFVQLPAFDGSTNNENWPLLRESQLETLKNTKNTGMVVTIDTGDKKNIHPGDKKIVAGRVYNEALRLIYQEKTSGCGPLFQNAKILDNKIIVYFQNQNGRLKFAAGKEGKGFIIAGEDHKFFPANATIDGSTVFVSLPEVPKPFSVRYAWEGFPEVTLFDSNNLPASPFRTDKWD